ncbi:MAG: ferritin-like domain-containing protein [Marmoricola sp.]
MTPTESLQAALAGEHAAVYLTGVLGAQASKSRQPALYAALLGAYRAHRRCRDQLTVLIAAHDADPVAADPAYDIPAGLGTTAELNDAALQVERRIAKTYGQLIENTTGGDRRWALVALDDAAVRQLEFRGTPEMFPGSAS